MTKRKAQAPSSRDPGTVELKLAEEQDFVRTFLDASVDTIIVFEPDTGTPVRWNRAFRSISGYTDTQIAAMRAPQDFLAPQDQDEITPVLEEIVQQGRTRVEALFKTRDGTVIPFEYSVAAVAESSGDPRYVLAIGRNISERRRAEQALRESEERFRTLAEEINDGLYIMDDRGVHLYANRAMARIYGLEDPRHLLGTSFLDRVDPDQRDGLARDFARAMATGEFPERLDVCVRHPDGSVGELVVRPVPVYEGDRIVGARGLATDVTQARRAGRQQRKLEEQLGQSQKMEAIGRLAGGVAHDFNNLLTAIQGYADLVLGSLGSEDPLRSEVEEIRRASRRAASLTQDLLAFSRRQVAQPRVVSLSDVLGNCRRMLDRIIGEDIHIVMDLATDTGCVKVDPHQVDQILVNLLVNARDAMPDGGQVTIRTNEAELSEADCQSLADLSPGPHVEISVTDNGPGMDQETLGHIFEPFFTTHGKEGGTGLGLATVYGVVRQNKGSITVESKLGEGTAFRIYLPCVDAPPSSETPPSIPPRSRGTETILLVEDEELVRNLALRILQSRGYNVLTASGGDEAIRLCLQHDGPIHLMLTDVVLPGLDGQTLHQRIIEILPDLPVLFMSGYPRDVIARRGLLQEGTAFLPKPFTPTGLLQHVRTALD